MLELRNVSFAYSKRVEPTTPLALRDISLNIHEGELIAIIGHNGSGKSTLARLFNALIQPSSGSVLIDGLIPDMHTLPEIRQKVGLVFQHPDDQIIANTVLDEIAFGPENLGLSQEEIQQRVDETMQLLQLTPYASLSPSDLSVGMKQRLAIAGVLAMRPRYLFLDEPTTMLPSALVQDLLTTLKRLAKEQGIAVVHITHFMHEVVHFDRVFVMHEGRLELQGTPAEIFAESQRLQEIGLDIPMVTRLGQRLQAHGYALPSSILTTDQLKAALCSLH